MRDEVTSFVLIAAEKVEGTSSSALHGIATSPNPNSLPVISAGWGISSETDP